MRHTLSSAVPDNETAQSGAFDHRQTGRTPEISEPSVADAFHAIERIESRLSQVAPGVASTAPAGIEDTLRGFESRISTLTERLSSGTRPIGRRGVSHEDDLKSAVAQIRSRQADLDQGGARPQPSAPTADRSHGDILLALRGDMARLSGQIEATRGPERVAIEQLNREVASLRGSIGSLASRADVGQIEQSVAALSSQVAQARLSGGGLAEASAQFKTLQATIQRLTEMQASRDDGRVSRQIEQLSTKLDGMTAGAAPGLRDALVGQLHDIRAMMADAAPAAQIATLSHHVSALRDEIATLAARQVDPQEFAALKNSVDDMRRLVPVSGEMRPASGTADLASGLKPVEVLLHALVDKLDSVERQVGSRSVADPDSLDSLERQIATLATRLSETTGRDPSVAHLEQAMSQLMREISTWREDAVAAADKAARNVIAETLATGAPVALDTHLGRDVADLKQRYEATEKRTEASLVAVNRTLEDVAARIATLGGQSAPREAEQHSPASEVPVQVATAAESCEPSLAEGAALKRLTDAIVADQARHEPPLGHGTAPAVTPAEDEILLEPGSARPPVTAGRKAAPDVDAADIKTSFIAAARRAAQAAADDATTARRRMPATREAAGSESGAASSDLMGRLRAMVDRRRRPLLLSAAAVVLAIGTFQIARERIENDAPAPVATAQFPAGLLPELAEANRLARDPVTTASITPAEPVQASAQRADLPAVPAQNSAPAASQAAAAAPTLPGKPAAPPANAPEPGVTPAALKQAAQAGNPVAAYEFGARAAEGRGMPRDLQVAARFFEKAAEKGLAAAQYRTGNIYEKGLGVARDVEAAKAWYRKAAENGNTRAMHNLAVLLAEGAAGKPDYQSAIGWFERAAEQGMRDSQFNLAVLLARGLGTTQNLPQSYTWFAVAAAGGDDDAAKKRDEVGSRLPAPDLARAKLAAEHWRVTPPNAAANEVHLPANGFVESAQTTAAAAKKPAREGRV